MTDKHPILIVDDEPDVLFSLKGLLRHDFELFTAESGAEALEIMRSRPIHVIMSDQRMPGMTGMELVKQARAEFPTTIRIVFTGYADIKAVVEAINSCGLFRYITKPWDPDDLVSMLHRAVRRYDQDTGRLRFATDAAALADSVINHPAIGEQAEQADELLVAHAKQLIEPARELFPAAQFPPATKNGNE